MDEHAPDERPEQMADRDAEIALMSACLYSKNARIEAKKHLLVTDLWWPAHQQLYAAMLNLDRHGKTVDPVTVRAALAPERRPGDGLDTLLVTVSSATGIPEAVADYAAIVRRWGLRRRMVDTGRKIVQRALSPAESPERLATEAITMMTGLRDTGTDVTAVTLRELMTTGDDDDDTPEWVIPGLLEREDRLMLTGSEGAGKSALLRQLSIMPAAGLHPFTGGIMPPIKALIVDCENKGKQVRRQTRPLLTWLHEQPGTSDPMERVLIDTPGRINVMRDRDLSRIHQAIDAWQPDLVVLGPIYKMSPKALSNDDDAAPFLAALDTITDRGCALILEAHAGHGKSGTGRNEQRDLRPRGSSALLGWPEFGYGLRGLGGGLADLEPWRGSREQRAWPVRLRRAPGHRWVETHPDHRPEPEDHGPRSDDGTLTPETLM